MTQSQFMAVRAELSKVGVSIIENIYDEFVVNLRANDGDGGIICGDLNEARREGLALGQAYAESRRGS